MYGCCSVATVLTVYGIETVSSGRISLSSSYVATVLTVYGIETIRDTANRILNLQAVATVLTVYGIETIEINASIIFLPRCCNSAYRLRY